MAAHQWIFFFSKAEIGKSLLDRKLALLGKCGCIDFDEQAVGQCGESVGAGSKMNPLKLIILIDGDSSILTILGRKHL